MTNRFCGITVAVSCRFGSAAAERSGRAEAASCRARISAGTQRVRILAGAAPETRDGFRDKGTKYSGQCARSDKTVSVRPGKTACIHPAKQRRSCRAKQRASVPANQQRSATYTRPGKTAYTRPGKTAAGPEGKMRVRDLRAVFRRIGRTYRPAGICGGTGPPGPTLPMPPDPGQHSSLQSRGQTVGRRTPSCRKNAPGRYGPTNRRYFLRFFKISRVIVISNIL